MTKDRLDKQEGEKLVQQRPSLSLDVLPVRTDRTNSTLGRPPAAPYLKEHVVKGKSYYSYCHGARKQIYLGSADKILKAVKGSAKIGNISQEIKI